MHKPSSCPKCQGSMSEGFVVDNTHGGRAVSSWVEGAPNKSFWVGVSLSGKEPVEIVTYRCNRCGFLESYAG
jgi:predicted nucleic-acid-binding Zn-ribbon protein